jgi:hypothetical protein
MKRIQFLVLLTLMVLVCTKQTYAQKKPVFISIVVRDAATQKSAQGVNISYFNKKGQLINCDQPTNPQGRVDFEAKDFQPGDKISVIAEKTGTFAEKEETLRIVGYGGNENQIFFELLPDEGKEVSIKLINNSKKRPKPVAGATIRFKNHIGKLEEKYTDENGEVRFSVFKRVGKEIEFNIQNNGYFPEIKRVVIGEDGIDLLIQMEQENPFTICDCMPYTTGALVGLAGGMYLGSQKAYSDYKDFKNTNRESNYSQANTRNRIAIVSAGLAGASLAGWIICWKHNRDLEMGRQRTRRHTGITPLRSSDLANYTNGFQIGIAFKF